MSIPWGPEELGVSASQSTARNTFANQPLYLKNWVLHKFPIAPNGQLLVNYLHNAMAKSGIPLCEKCEQFDDAEEAFPVVANAFEEIPPKEDGTPNEKKRRRKSIIENPQKFGPS